MADLKTYSVLIAWNDNDREQGAFGEIVRATNAEEAEAKARAAMREAHIANHCDSDEDADEIAESCAEYEHKGFGDEVVFGGRVIDLHQGAIWKAAELEKALRECLASLNQCQEQISQMRGMFNDEDGAIQRAVDDAQEAHDVGSKIIAEIDAL